MEFNASSNNQLVQLLFTPYNKGGKLKNQHGTEVSEESIADGSYEWDYPKDRQFRTENLSGFVKEGRSEPLKFRNMTISGLGLKPTDFT